MSEIISETPIERDGKTGRFVAGNSGNGGRRPGARGKLSSLFLEDLHSTWLEYGATALARCAVEEPSQFCKLVGSLLPRDVNLNVALDAAEYATRFRTAIELLGNEAPQMKIVHVRHK